MSARYSATYRSDPKNVALSRRAVATFARSCGFSQEEVSEIEMAAGEALANAAEHGLDLHGGSFTVRCTYENDSLAIEVTDTGRGFRQGPQHDNVPGAIRGRGFGMSIMRALMNSITYSKNGSTVRLVRRRTIPLQNGNGSSPP